MMDDETKHDYGVLSRRINRTWCSQDRLNETRVKENGALSDYCGYSSDGVGVGQTLSDWERDYCDIASFTGKSNGRGSCGTFGAHDTDYSSDAGPVLYNTQYENHFSWPRGVKYVE